MGSLSANPQSNPAPASLRAHPVAAFVVWFLIVFLVLFPKGGFKIGDTPLTWGYLFLGASLVPLTFIRVYSYSLRVRKLTLLAGATLVPFQFLLIYSFQAFGIQIGPGITVSLLVTFFLFPLAFLFVYPAYYDRIDGLAAARWLRFCILAAAIFGIFLFFFYPLTGVLPQIPYFTVNAGDYGEIIQTKHIVRGVFVKLISTYNNGNLYGISTLMLLPLYDKLEPKTWKRLVVRCALVLTLSRTVWAGLILEQVLSLGRIALDALANFPRMKLGAAASRLGLIAVTSVTVAGALLFNSATLAFLFDPELGGRANYLETTTQHITFLPSIPFIGFLEVSYATALGSFGIAGLISFLLIFAGPLVLLILNRRSILRSPLRTAACKGLVLYMLISASDGGLELIPVMAFYWFVYMIFLEGWPGGYEPPLAGSAPLTPRPIAASC